MPLGCFPQVRSRAVIAEQRAPGARRKRACRVHGVRVRVVLELSTLHTMQPRLKGANLQQDQCRE